MDDVSPGTDIALEGIDGIGKSSVSDGLAVELRDRGFQVTTTSWRDYVRSDREIPGHAVLSTLYTGMFRSLHSAGIATSGQNAHDLLPSRDEEFVRGGEPFVTEGSSVRVALDTDRPGTFLAAGLIEVAARLVERDLVVRPALHRGDVVIQDGSGIKTSVKLGLVTKDLLGTRDGATGPVDEYLAFARSCLQHWASPMLSVLVTGDPELAYRWRMRQSGHIGRGEHLDIAGEPVESTFVDLQASIQDSLSSTAADEGWPRITMLDQARETNVATAVDVVLKALADRGLLMT